MIKKAVAIKLKKRTFEYLLVVEEDHDEFVLHWDLSEVSETI